MKKRGREREREREREEGALGPGGHVDSVERAFRSDGTRLRMEGRRAGSVAKGYNNN